VARSGSSNASTESEPNDEPKAKRAELVAEAIERRIIESGWPVGRVIGSESDLMQEFGVSRAVAREAVRVLESRQLIRPRRGQGGGIVVVEPDESAVIDTMTLCMVYEGISPAELSDLRSVLELQAVEGIIRHLDDHIRDQLQEHLESERKLLSIDEYAMIDNRSSHGFHLLLTELSGNRALHLFQRALLGSVQRRLEYSKSSPELVTAGAQVHFAHQRITEAILAGDVETALHRMDRHLNAINHWMATHPSWEERAQ
jgi:DNA-binding FadR family transcriptional regulator